MVVRTLLMLGFPLVAVISPALGQQEADAVTLDGKEVEVVERVGTAVVLRVPAPMIPRSGRGGSLSNGPRFSWYLVQDTALGVVFHKPSGVKTTSGALEYDGDIELIALVAIDAVEVVAWLFNVWGERTGSVSRTAIHRRDAGDKFDLDDARWSEKDDPIYKHFGSIMFVSRVLYEDGTVVEADQVLLELVIGTLGH